MAERFGVRLSSIIRSWARFPGLCQISFIRSGMTLLLTWSALIGVALCLSRCLLAQRVLRLLPINYETLALMIFICLYVVFLNKKDYYINNNASSTSY